MLKKDTRSSGTGSYHRIKDFLLKAYPLTVISHEGWWVGSPKFSHS